MCTILSTKVVIERYIGISYVSRSTIYNCDALGSFGKWMLHLLHRVALKIKGDNSHITGSAICNKYSTHANFDDEDESRESRGDRKTSAL